MKVKGVPFEYKLFTFVTGQPSTCPVCGAYRELRKPLRAVPTCGSKSCQEANRLAKVRAGVAGRTIARSAESYNLLPVKVTPDALAKAANANTGGERKFFELLQDRYQHQFLKATKANNGCKPNEKQFRYFLCEEKLPTCIECNCVLKNPTSKRCKGNCASKHAIRKNRKAGFMLGNADDKTKAKMQATMLERYQAKGSFGSQTLKAKQQATMMERHGVKNSAHMPSTRHAFVERYKDKRWVKGVTKKTQETMVARYGKGWRQIMADRMSNARYKRHDVVVGEHTFRVQGYEPYVLRLLESKGIKGEHIEVYGRTFEDYDTGRMYRPDIVVKRKRLIIEVKSTYTAGLNKNGSKLWRQLVENSRLVASEGESLTLVVVQPKKGYVAIKDPHRLARAQVRRLVKHPKAFPWND